jgi:hypothetical protein
MAGWIDADTVSAIASTRYDAMRACLWIDLKDGTTLVDSGDSIALRGRLTWSAALETAAAAERHGWQTVEVSGGQAYKDAVTMACLLRGIEVTNHTLSPKAQAVFDRLRLEQGNCSERSIEWDGNALIDRNEVPDASKPTQGSDPSSLQIHCRITKRRFVSNTRTDDNPEARNSMPAYRPRSTIAMGGR